MPEKLESVYPECEHCTNEVFRRFTKMDLVVPVLIMLCAMCFGYLLFSVITQDSKAVQIEDHIAGLVALLAMVFSGLLSVSLFKAFLATKKRYVFYDKQGNIHIEKSPPVHSPPDQARDEATMPDGFVLCLVNSIFGKDKIIGINEEYCTLDHSTSRVEHSLMGANYVLEDKYGNQLHFDCLENLRRVLSLNPFNDLSYLLIDSMNGKRMLEKALDESYNDRRFEVSEHYYELAVLVALIEGSKRERGKKENRSLIAYTHVGTVRKELERIMAILHERAPALCDKNQAEVAGYNLDTLRSIHLINVEDGLRRDGTQTDVIPAEEERPAAAF